MRPIALAGAQLGAIQRDETREQVVARILALMRLAADKKARLIVFPELALTTFFLPISASLALGPSSQ